jgi:hypothetical protein
MTPKRLFYALSALCALLFIGIGAVVYFGNSFLSKEAAKIADARADDELIEQRKALKNDLAKTIDDYADLKTLATKFLPDSKNQDDLIAEFYKIASDNDIDISGLSFTASGAKISSSSQTTPLKDAKNVLVFPFNVTNFTADFDQLISFMQDLENNRRKLQITQIQLQPDDKTGLISVPSMSVESYIKGVVVNEKQPAASPQTTENTD